MHVKHKGKNKNRSAAPDGRTPPPRAAKVEMTPDKQRQLLALLRSGAISQVAFDNLMQAHTQQMLTPGKEAELVALRRENADGPSPAQRSAGAAHGGNPRAFRRER